ncbi:MAG: DUF1320 domain-containing protein [Magnetococcales bacterium]|nr:DUF1320 domain-containing protein [Magnetococcales bacterium]
MAYVTAQEMIDLYGREAITDLTDRADPPTYQIDAGILQRAIDAATELLDGYLGRRYQLPLDTVPVDLQEHARSAVFFNLHRGRIVGISESVRARYDDAVSWLDKVAKGEILLRAATPPATTGVGSPGFVTGGRTFSRDTLRYF